MKLTKYAIDNEIDHAKHEIFMSLNDAKLLCRWREGAVDTTLTLIQSRLWKMLVGLEIVVPADVEPVPIDTAQLAEVTDA